MTNPRNDGAFDPETITLLADVLDRVWKALSPDLKATTARAHIAEYILTIAAHGEHGAAQLYESALGYFAKPNSES